jgi:hypothetical protein
MSQTSIPQIYIPRVHTSYTWQSIKEVFDELFGEGCVKRVDVVKVRPRNEGDKPPPFNRVYVHMKKWEASQHPEMRQALLAGETVNLHPDENKEYFWMCVLNTRGEQEKPKGKPVFQRAWNASTKTSVTVGDVLFKDFNNFTVVDDVKPIHTESSEA